MSSTPHTEPAGSWRAGSAAGPLVCVVDDDVSVRESVEGLFREEGFHVDLFESAEGFLGRRRGQAPDCLVVDLVLPGMSGLDLHQELARTGMDTPTILLTGHGDIATSVRAMKAGAVDFLTKPFDADDLVTAVRHAVSRRQPERKAGVPRRIDGMVGESETLRRVLQQVELVADTDVTVLITGESGTGKELVARAIHERSRRQGPLVRMNCAAIPESLFESELFGHARGSFTGALHDRVGRFEAAQGGTLLLDEIGEVPLAMQPKLLRVIQEKELERVGETRSRKVDVRIVAATNRDLGAEVEAGRFREDLFYRLNVFPIENPPLRERREDIPLLAEHFVHVSARRLRRAAPRLSEGALRQLAAREWPGNIRELENVIERAVILAVDGQLRFDAPAAGDGAVRVASPGAASALPLLSRAALEQHQREAIVAALEQTGGRVSGPRGAAELLGMKASTLFSRMTVLGLRQKPAETPSPYPDEA
jgi:DNA-binding NtrC family response regulator